MVLLWANPTGQTCDLRGHTVIVELNTEEKTVRITPSIFPDTIYENNRKVFLKARILFSDSCFYKSHPTTYAIFLMSPLCHVADTSGSSVALGKKGHLVTTGRARCPLHRPQECSPSLFYYRSTFNRGNGKKESVLYCVPFPSLGQTFPCSLSGNLHPCMFLPLATGLSEISPPGSHPRGPPHQQNGLQAQAP